MVERQLLARGIRDPRVLAAMAAVPREEFVPAAMRGFAYDDRALPIDHGQTISQPYIVALTCEALRIGPDDRVLDIGAGSGYATAVLARLARQVYAIERLPALAASAGERLARLGIANVELRCGDGTAGWPDQAPFDAIAVGAGSPEIPLPLQRQLAIGGRLVIPVGSTPRYQDLLRITRLTEHELTTERLCPVAFVPLIGHDGWGPDAAA
jgi:protein-L-isoaspartate(D-aspartate) O-methyltransferase